MLDEFLVLQLEWHLWVKELRMYVFLANLVDFESVFPLVLYVCGPPVISCVTLISNCASPLSGGTFSGAKCCLTLLLNSLWFEYLIYVWPEIYQPLCCEPLDTELWSTWDSPLWIGDVLHVGIHECLLRDIIDLSVIHRYCIYIIYHYIQCGVTYLYKTCTGFGIHPSLIPTSR